MEQFKKQLLEVQESLRQIQAQHKIEIDDLKKQVADQQILISQLQKQATPSLPTGPEANSGAAIATGTAKAQDLFPTTDSSLIPAQSAQVSQTSQAPPQPTMGNAFPTTDPSLIPAQIDQNPTPMASAPTGLTAPITLAGAGKSYLNISFDGVIAAAASTAHDLDHIELGDHDPQQRGFNARNLEIAMDGAVDPYFEAFVNIVFKLDNQNETSVEAEEAFMQTTTLPFNLQLKVGQFFAPFGRINPTHPHTWDFADAPLVAGGLLGSDGLRGVGAQMSWVLPTSWYSQAMLAVMNGQGNTGFSFRNLGEEGVFYGRPTVDRPLRGMQDLLFIPRWENSIDLTPTQTLLFGASAAFGPNDTGPTSKTQIYGLDTFYKWKPSNAEGGWPFVKWQSEAMFRRFGAGQGLDESFPTSETFNDWGAYSQVVWGFKKGWTTGLRGDFLHMTDSPVTDDPSRQSRWRISGDLTFYPSEFSKIRLQYNHDFLIATHFLPDRGVDSLFLQFEFALGAHGAHKF